MLSIRAILPLILVLALWLLPPAAAAQEGAAAGQPAGPPTEEVRRFLLLLSDSSVQEWLRSQIETAPATPSESSAGFDDALGNFVADRLRAIREHWRALLTAVPQVPGEIGDGFYRLRTEGTGYGGLRAFVALALLLGVGFTAEYVFVRLSRRFRRRVLDAPEDSVVDRLGKVGLRMLLALLAAIVFGLTSIGAFLAVDWPPLLGSVLTGYLAAAVLIRVAARLSRVLLGIPLAHLRIVPMETPLAQFWYRRAMPFVSVLLIGWASAVNLNLLDVARPVPAIVAYAFGLLLVAIAVETAWARRGIATATPEGAPGQEKRSALVTLLFSGFAILVWGLWVSSAMRLFWLLAVLVLVPAAVRVSGRAVENLLRPVGSLPAQGKPPSVLAALLERGVRVLLIVGSIYFLAWVWGIDIRSGSGGQWAQAMAAALNILVIALVAELIWHLAKTAIDQHLQEGGTPDASHQQARLRTLLPTLKKFLLAVLLCVSALMALSAAGVEIGPLLAGAGVLGIAVGFGAQTLVKDIISGMFYLLDDAFRVGEYIESGTYKGSVEAFSLRSVKLRHHRGPLYTVPFGVLGAVVNHSRDWVIDKITVGVTYDTDLAKAKKVIKQVSAEMMKDPELAGVILEPLKSQGVEQLGDFAIQLRMKVKTKPGEQFIVRRAAYDRIKKAFDANAIKFALPTVQVTGGEASVAAAGAAVQAMQGSGDPTTQR